MLLAIGRNWDLELIVVVGVRSSGEGGRAREQVSAPVTACLCRDELSLPQTWGLGVAEDSRPLERKEGRMFKISRVPNLALIMIFIFIKA